MGNAHPEILYRLAADTGGELTNPAGEYAFVKAPLFAVLFTYILLNGKLFTGL